MDTTDEIPLEDHRYFLARLRPPGESESGGAPEPLGTGNADGSTCER